MNATESVIQRNTLPTGGTCAPLSLRVRNIHCPPRRAGRSKLTQVHSEEMQWERSGKINKRKGRQEMFSWSAMATDGGWSCLISDSSEHLTEAPTSQIFLWPLSVNVSRWCQIIIYIYKFFWTSNRKNRINKNRFGKKKDTIFPTHFYPLFIHSCYCNIF